jgi:8-amino-7-oxononanoate synthase
MERNNQSSIWREHFRCQLEELSQQRLLRHRGASGIADPESGLGGEPLEQGLPANRAILDFGSNDYLGLRHHPAVLNAARQALQHQGWGSAASPVLSGYRDIHRRLECSLSGLSGCEDCMVFSSGYACNVGVLSTLIDEDTIVFSDRLNHASLIDGIRLARGVKVIYDHCDLQHLKQLLSAHRNKKLRGLIVTESVFSMDGDEAPLEEMTRLAEQNDCGLIVDEAHATGLYGANGAGLASELGIGDRVLVKLGTLSKSVGGIGGFAAGQSCLIELLVNRCRSYVFSTAPPAAAMAAADTAVGLLPSLDSQRQYLVDLSRRLRERLRDQGWPVPPGRSPIVPMIVGEAEETLAISKRLIERNIYVPAIRPPTVPVGTSRLRISLSTNHSWDDIDLLCESIGNCVSGFDLKSFDK